MAEMADIEFESAGCNASVTVLPGCHWQYVAGLRGSATTGCLGSPQTAYTAKYKQCVPRLRPWH